MSLWASNDAVDEDAETLTVALGDLSAESLGTHVAGGAAPGAGANSFDVDITDDDTAGLKTSVVGDGLRVSEPSGTDTLLVALASRPTSDVTVTVTSGDSSALLVSTAGGAKAASVQLTFTPPRGLVSQAVTVHAVDDDVDNTGDVRDVTVTVSSSSGDTKYEGLSASVDAEVADDDLPAAPQVQFTSAAYTAGEAAGDRAVSLGLSLSPAPSWSVTVGYTVTGTATSGDDFTALSGNVSIPAEATTASIPITVLNDTTDEPPETIVVTLDERSAYSLGTTAATTVTVADDDATVVRLARVDSGLIVEGVGSADVAVSLGRALAAGETAAVRVLFGGGAGLTDADVALVPKQGATNTGVTVGPVSGTAGALYAVVTLSGAGARTAELTLTLVDEVPALDETAAADSDSMTVSLGLTSAVADGTNLAGGVIADGDDNSFELTVLDDDGPAGVLIAETGGSTRVSENNSAPQGVSDTYTVRLATDPLGTVTVEATASGGVEVSAGGAAAAATATLTFTSSNWWVPQEVKVTAAAGTDDSLDNTGAGPHSTGRVAHSATGYGSVATADSVEVGIVDDEATEVTLSGGGSTFEGSKGTVDVTVSLKRALVAGEVAEVPLTLTSLKSSEDDEPAILSGPARLLERVRALSWKASGTGVTLMADPAAGRTAPSRAALLVRFEGAGAQTATITFTAVNGDRDRSSETVNVRVPTDRGLNTPRVRKIPGTQDDVVVTNLEGGLSAAGSVLRRSIYIYEPSQQREASLTVSGGGTVAEGALPLTVTVTLNGNAPAHLNIPVRMRTLGLPTASLADFTLSNNGIVAISNRSRTGTIALTATADRLIEGDEFLILEFGILPSPVVAAKSGVTAKVTITDAQAGTPVTVTMAGSNGDSDGNAVEGAGDSTGYRTITLTLNRALAGSETVTVPLTVAGATVATDYTFGLQPTSQTGVSLLATTGGTHTAQNPAVEFSAGASSATLRLTPVDNDKRTQPYVVISYGTGARAPSASVATLGTVSGGPVGVVLVDDESGDIVVPSDWALLPSGLLPGAEFRLMFVTSQTRAAESSDIDVYNRWAQGVVAVGGHAELKPYGGLVTVVASTATADARVNTAMWDPTLNSNAGGHTDSSANASDSGVAVHWLAGPPANKVADNYFDFYDNSWDGGADQSAVDTTESGAERTATATFWTGSLNDGTAQATNRLGATQVTAANVASGDTLSGSAASRTTQKPMLALSPVFKVAAAVEPELTFAAGSYSVDEDDGTIDVTVNADVAPLFALTVALTATNGTAAAGSDFTAPAATFTFPAGETSAMVSVTILDDSILEGTETFTLTLGAGTGYTVGSDDASTTVTINDQDTVTVQLNSMAYTVGEGDGTVTITVLKTGAAAIPVEVALTPSDGTATGGSGGTGEGVDYDDDALDSVMIPAQSTGAEVTIAITDDSDDELSEDFTVALTVAAGQRGVSTASPSSATVTITDNDDPVTVTMAASDGDSDGNAVEGAGNSTGYRTITLTLGRALAGSETVTVPLTVAGATVTTDYTFGLSGTNTGVTLTTTGGTHTAQNPAVEFSAGASSATLRLTPVDNNVRTQPYVVVSYGTGSRAPSASVATLGTLSGGPVGVGLVDDETGDIVVPSDWALLPAGLSEGGEFRLMFVTSQTRAAESSDIDVYNRWAQGVVAVGGHAELKPYGGLVTVVASTATADARVNTGMWDPTLNSNAGGHTDSSANASDSGVAVHWLAAPSANKVADNYFDFYDNSWDGGADQSAVDTTESGAARTATATFWTGSLNDGTAQATNRLGATQVTAANVASGDTLSGSAASRTTQKPMLALSPVFKVTAAVEPELTFDAATYSVDENVNSGTIDVTVNADEAPLSALTVALTATNGTAAAGSDFTAPAATFTFPAGETSAMVSVTILDDSILEGTEEFTLTLGAGTGYTVGTQASTTVTINDQDTVTVQLNSMDYTVGEGDGTVTITVLMTGAAAIPVEVALTPSDGTATGGSGGTGEGVDYDDDALDSVTISAQSTGAEATIAITDDSDDEPSEDFTVALTVVEGQRGVSTASPSSATVTITDNDDPITVTMATSDGDSDGNAVEGAGNSTGYRTITLTLNRALAGSETVTVPLTVAGATVTTDYTFGLSGTNTGVSLTTSGGTHTAQNPAVEFAAGASSATLRLTPVDNSARTQPYVVVGYGTGSRAPSASGGVTLGDLSGGPVGVVLVDDETGDIEVPLSWALKPSAVAAGGAFRLMFMTSEAGDATSSDIADYDEFVRRVGASGGHQDVLPYVGFFKVFASTRSSSAPSANVAGRGHVGIWQSGSNVWADGSTSAASAGTSVYWLGGSKVADNYFDFCDSGWDNRWTSGTNHLRHEDGNAGDGSKVWTGMNNNCTLHANPLGHASQTAWGPGTQAASGGPLNKGQEANTNSNRFYAMSPEFKVPTTPVVQFRADTYTATEASGSRSVTVLVEASPAPTANLDVSYTIGGTATNGTDYTMIASPVSVGTDGLGRITITVTDDIVDDDDETIMLTLSSGSGYTVGSSASETVTITDDDAAPLRIRLSVSRNSVAEDDGLTPITVTAEVVGSTRFASAKTVSVTVTPLADTASTNYVDMQAVNGFDITIPAGAAASRTGRTPSFRLMPVNDVVNEVDNTVTVAATSGSMTATSTINLTDDDAAPSGIALSVSPVSVSENDGPRQVTVTATVTGGTRFGTAKTVAVTVAGHDTANQVQFTQVSGFNINIAAEAMSGSHTFTLTPTPDSSETAAGAALISGSLSGVTVTGATVAITDGDGLLKLSVPSLKITEGGQGSFEVRLASKPSGIVQVDVSVPESSGVSLSQRNSGIPRRQKLTYFLVRSEWDVGVTVWVNAHAEGDADPDDVMTEISLSAEAGGYDGATASLPVTVTDITPYEVSNDDFAFFSVYKGDRTKPIGVPEAGGWAHFAVMRARVWRSDDPFPADFEQIPNPWGFQLCFEGTATLGVDYQVRNRFNLPLRLNGNCSYTNNPSDGTHLPTGGDRAHFYLRLLDDAHEDSGETIEVYLHNPEGTSLNRGFGRVLRYVISNHDALDAPSPRALISADSDAVTEGAPARFAVQVSPAHADGAATAVTVELTGAAGYLAADQPRTVTVDVPATGVATFAVPTVADGTRESDGQITATVVDGDGYDPDPDPDYGAATVKVRDDDPNGAAPVVSVTADAASVAEGAAAGYTITVDPAPVLPLVVSVTVTQDGDWGAKTGTRTVTVGTTGTATIAVDTTDDNRYEPDGAITVTIEDDYDYDRHATARTATVAVTSDDIALPQVSIADAAATETDRYIRFHITLDKPAAETVTVSIRLRDGTAKSGADYISLATTARIPAGQTSVVHEVYIFGDNTPEPPETFTARIYRVIGPAEAHPTQHTATGTITETPTPQQTQPTNTQPEPEPKETNPEETQPEPEDTNTDTDTEDTDTDDDTDTEDADADTDTDTEDTDTEQTDTDPEPADEPEISITAGADITEGGDATFTLTATPAPAADLDITVELSQTGDHATTGTRTVTISTGGSATLILATTDDSTDEPDGTITATIDTGAGYSVSATDATATVAVTDDDIPELTITAGNDVTEGSDATFTVTATPTPHAALDVTVAVSQTGDHATTTGTRTVTIPTSGTYTLTVTTTDDSTDETDGTITVTINTGAGYTVSATDATATVAVTDNDDPPQQDSPQNPEPQPETATGAPTPQQCALPDDAVTVAEVTQWRDQLLDNDLAARRWNHVLTALGDDTGLTAMTVEAARTIYDQLQNTRWDRTVRTLEALAQCNQ